MNTNTTAPVGVVSSSQLGFCACIGPMFGEPYCYCEMVRSGMPLNKADRVKDEAKLREALDRVLGTPSDKQPNLFWKAAS